MPIQKNYVTKLLLGALLLICLVHAASAASLLVAASDSSAEDKARADYVCDGVQDQIEINAALNALTAPGSVILSAGTFYCDTSILPPAKTTLKGQGATNTFIEMTWHGMLEVNEDNVTLEQFHISGNSYTSGLQWYGVIMIRASHCAVHDITGTCDDTICAVFHVFVDALNGYSPSIIDTEFINCKAIDCGGFGFRNHAMPAHGLVQDIRYTDCQAINCGRYEQQNPWITGFDLAEQCDIDNLLVERCHAEGCLESGFHFEWLPITVNAVLTDCTSFYNGQKPYPSDEPQEFLAGYYVGRGDVTFINCHAEGNSYAGFHADDASNVKMYGCTDKDTAIGRSDFSIYEPASFVMFYTFSEPPFIMEDCSSINSNGRGLDIGKNPTFAINGQVKNFVMTNPAGVDGTAARIAGAKGSFDIHASGNQVQTLIDVINPRNVDFTGSIVSDVAQPWVFEGSDSYSTTVHDVITTSNTLPVGSTGIILDNSLPSWAVQIENCAVVSPTSTPTPTPVPTPVPTQTPTPVPTPVPTQTPTPVPTPVPTQTPTPVPTPVPTQTPTPVPTPVPPQTPTPVPTPVPTQPSGEVLFVVGKTTLNNGDAAVKNRLEASGYTVNVVDDGASSALNAKGKDLVLISSTCEAGRLYSKFRDVNVPVMTWEPYIYDDMKMTGTALSIDYSRVSGQTQVQITDTDHPLAAGLNGIVTVTSVKDREPYGVPGNDCAKVASLSQDQSRYVIFGYEAGAEMVGMNAPAKRVGFFLYDASAASLTTDGWKLFDAAVGWSVGTETPAPIPTPEPTPLPTQTPTPTPTPVELVAAFTADSVTGSAPLQVTFIDVSQGNIDTGNPNSWTWYFGDGDATFGKNPTHTYTEPGTYQVTLVVINEDGIDYEQKPGFITVTGE